MKETSDPALEATRPSHPLTLSVCAKDGLAAIAFYEEALGARRVHVLTSDDGLSVVHAELRADDVSGGFTLYTGSDVPGGVAGVAAGARGAVSACVSVPESDVAVKRMHAAGGEIVTECADQFYGMRVGKLVDPFGVCWSFAHELKN